MFWSSRLPPSVTKLSLAGFITLRVLRYRYFISSFLSQIFSRRFVIIMLQSRRPRGYFAESMVTGLDTFVKGAKCVIITVYFNAIRGLVEGSSSVMLWYMVNSGGEKRAGWGLNKPRWVATLVKIKEGHNSPHRFNNFYRIDCQPRPLAFYLVTLLLYLSPVRNWT